MGEQGFQFPCSKISFSTQITTNSPVDSFYHHSPPLHTMGGRRKERDHTKKRNRKRKEEIKKNDVFHFNISLNLNKFQNLLDNFKVSRNCCCAFNDYFPESDLIGYRLSRYKSGKVKQPLSYLMKCLSAYPLRHASSRVFVCCTYQRLDHDAPLLPHRLDDIKNVYFPTGDGFVEGDVKSDVGSCSSDASA